MEDQVFHDLEQRYLLLHREHEILLSDNRNVKEYNEKLKSERDLLLARAEGAERAKAELTLATQQLDSKSKELASEVETTKEKLSRVMAENDRLREDLQAQSQELTALQVRLKDAQVQCSEAQSKELPLQYELSKITRERDLLLKDVAGMKEEMHRLALAERSKAFESADRINGLELKLVTLESDLEAKIKEVAMLKSQLSLSHERYDDEHSKFIAAEAQWIAQSAATAQEMDALKRLTEVYKNYFDEASAKVEDLENRLAQADERHSHAIAETKASVEAQRAEFAERAQAERDALEARIAELQSALAQAESSAVALRSPPPTTSSHANAPSALASGFSITEAYDRVVSLENELIEERRAKKDMELYMNQILKEIESKAPALAKQRRDYQRMVEYHSQMTSKLDEFAVENARLKAAVQDLEGKVANESRQKRLLEQHSADLSLQIQHLLRSTVSSDPAAAIHLIEGDDTSMGADELVSQRLVTFRSISELQQRNAELLNIIRTLTAEAQDSASAQASATGGNAASRGDTAAVLEELEQLREARARSEEMIAVVIQQRDMYKSLVDGGALPTAAPPQPTLLLTSGSSNNDSLLQSQLSQSAESNKRLQDQVSRLEEANKLLHETLDKLRAELTAAQLSGAHATSEARFQRERVERLEDSLKLAQQEANVFLTRRADTDRILQEAQRELRQRDERLAAFHEELRAAKEAHHRLEIELEVTKASEVRLMQQVADTREEMKGNTSLAEHLHRIERGLHDRAELEKQHIQREKDALEESYKALKKQVEDKTAWEQQRQSSMEDELRALQVNFERKNGEVALLNESLAREKEMLKTCQDRLALVEKQLALAQDRLASVHGAQIGDDLLEKAIAEKEVALMHASNEIESLKQQLAATDVHAEQYRKISAANESALKVVQAKLEESQQSFQAQLSDSLSALERSKAELAEQRNSFAQLLREMEEARDQERSSASAFSETTKALQAERDALAAENEQLKGHMDTVRVETETYKESARVAFENYERELQQHARAERDLRQEREQKSALRDEIEKLQARLAEQSLQVIRSDKAYAEEKEKRQQELDSLRAQVESLQSTNNAMHDQIQSYSAQIEKFFEQKLVSGVEAESAGAAAAPGVSSEEILELKRSSTEMREILKFMKREKEVLQAKLHLAESENGRYFSQLQSLQKTADELRAELKRESDKRVEVRSEEEFNRLLAEVSQLNVIRESNSHLRSENEELMKKLKALTADLESERSKRTPIEDALQKLTADKEALELVNDQLSNDVSYWKNRLQILVSRYNDVDPEEHRLLKTKLDDTLATLERVQASVEEAQTAHTAILAEKDKEIAAQRMAVESAEKNATTLRDRLRLFKSKIEDLESKGRENGKAVASKDSQITLLTDQLSSANNQIAELTSQMNELKRSLETTNAALTKATAASAAAEQSTTANVPGGESGEQAATRAALPKARPSLTKKQALKAKASPAEAASQATSAGAAATEPTPSPAEPSDEPAAKKSRVEEPSAAAAAAAPTPMSAETSAPPAADAEEATAPAVAMQAEETVPSTDNAVVPTEEAAAQPAPTEASAAETPAPAPVASAVAVMNPFASKTPTTSLFTGKSSGLGFPSTGHAFGSSASLFGAANLSSPVSGVTPSESTKGGAAPAATGFGTGPFLFGAAGAGSASQAKGFGSGMSLWKPPSSSPFTSAPTETASAAPEEAPVDNSEDSQPAASQPPAQAEQESEAMDTEVQSPSASAQGEAEAPPTAGSGSLVPLVGNKTLDAKRMEMRAQRFAQAAAAAAPAAAAPGALPTTNGPAATGPGAAPAGGPGRGRKRPAKGLKGTGAPPAAASTAAETSKPLSAIPEEEAGEILPSATDEEGAAE